MKAMLLSAVALFSATALAGPQFEGAVSRHISLPNQPAKIERALPTATRPIELRSGENLKPGRFEAMGETSSAARRAKATTYGAYYSFGEGTLKSSLVWDGGFYGYSYAVAHAFPYSAKFNAQLGNSWTMITASETLDLSENVDSDGNLFMDNLGIGNYYMPTINARDAQYTWSTRDTKGQILNYALFQDSWGMGTFDAFEVEAFYSGYSDGYGYGSSTPYGPSNLTLVDIGQVGGPLVVDDVCIWLVTETQLFATEDDYILVSLYDIHPNDTIIYNAYIRPENIEEATNGATCGVGKFVEIDVLEQLEQIDGKSERLSVAKSAIYNRLGNKKAAVAEMAALAKHYPNDLNCQAMYGEALIMNDQTKKGLAVYDQVLREDPDNNRVLLSLRTYYQAEDGTSYTWAVSNVSVTGDTLYNDFDVETTFNLDNFTVEYDPEVVVGLDFDTTYYADYNLVMLYVAVKELPQDVETRTTTVTFTSNEEVVYPITITQFGAGAGINNVAKDAEKEDNEVYNLQGVKVSKSEADLPAGVYVKNGKKFVK